MFFPASSIMNTIVSSMKSMNMHMIAPRPKLPVGDVEKGQVDPAHTWFAEGLTAMSPLHNVIVHNPNPVPRDAPYKTSRFVRGDDASMGKAKRELKF